MKNILWIILFSLCIGIYADNVTLPYETEFKINEEQLIIEKNLISKEKVKELAVFHVFSYPHKFTEEDIKQMTENMEVILVENITAPGYPYDKRIKRHNFYYVVNTLRPDGEIYGLNCFNAETTKYIVGEVPDYKNERKHYNYLMNRREVIEYAKKYFDFPEENIKIRAVFDHRFDIATAQDEPSWRYEITLTTGGFVSPDIPYNVDVIFIDPYVAGYNDKKEDPGPTNLFVKLLNHRLFTLSFGTEKSADMEKNKYIGVDK